VTCLDRLTGRSFDVKAKSIVFAGGPFTDSLRTLEDPGSKPAVGAGAGTHIVLPGYYSPSSMGLADMRTSRGAFLFFLPLKGSTVVGTTDRKSPAKTSPGVDEDEIQYLLNEVGRYLSPDLKVRRSDVLSAWRGWRPLAKDPHAPPDAPVSRDHVISVNGSTGVTFITGGKWTTYREMAEHTLDRVIALKQLSPLGPCVTKQVPLIGSEGFRSNMSIKLVQKYGLTNRMAEHLVSTYGMRAPDVCELSRPTGKRYPRFGKLLVDGYPFIEAEVEYGCAEYCRSIKDMLSLRMRIAFLNSEAAKELVPSVGEIMARRLGWSSSVRKAQEKEAIAYLSEFGGPLPDKSGAQLRSATFADLKALFRELDADRSGYLDEVEIGHAAKRLGFPFKDQAELRAAFAKIDTSADGRIALDEFVAWWNKADQDDTFFANLHKELNVTPDWEG
jgi:glycerol-3-phosphate dehydrogenase